MSVWHYGCGFSRPAILPAAYDDRLPRQKKTGPGYSRACLLGSDLGPCLRQRMGWTSRPSHIFGGITALLDLVGPSASRLPADDHGVSGAGTGQPPSALHQKCSFHLSSLPSAEKVFFSNFDALSLTGPQACIEGLRSLVLRAVWPALSARPLEPQVGVAAEDCAAGGCQGAVGS